MPIGRLGILWLQLQFIFIELKTVECFDVGVYGVHRGPGFGGGCWSSAGV